MSTAVAPSTEFAAGFRDLLVRQLEVHHQVDREPDDDREGADDDRRRAHDPR